MSDAPPSEPIAVVPDAGTMQASHVAAVAMFAIHKGVPLRDISRATGLGLSDITRLDGRVPGRHMPALWNLIKARHPEEPVTLEMAAWAPMSFMGVLGLVVPNLSTLREAQRVFARYSMIAADKLEVEIVEDEERSRVFIHHPLDAMDGGLAAESGMAMGVRIVRDVFGVRHELLAVEMTHQPHAPVADYEAYFGVPVSFGMPRNCMTWSAKELDVPVREGSPKLLELLTEQLRGALHRIRGDADPALVAEARAAIAVSGRNGDYSVGAIARRVGMSVRALQRGLARHDLSVKELVRQDRETRARELLSDHRLSVAEIASQLDYADERAFRRAFKRWTGCTPAEARRELM